MLYSCLDTWSLMKVQHFMVDHDLMWSLLASWKKVVHLCGWYAKKSYIAQGVSDWGGGATKVMLTIARLVILLETWFNVQCNCTIGSKISS
jgi:hypothetical protein